MSDSSQNNKVESDSNPEYVFSIPPCPFLCSPVAFTSFILNPQSPSPLLSSHLPDNRNLLFPYLQRNSSPTPISKPAGEDFSFYLNFLSKEKLDNIVSSPALPAFRTAVAWCTNPAVADKLTIGAIFALKVQRQPAFALDFFNTLKRHFNLPQNSLSDVAQNCAESYHNPQSLKRILKPPTITPKDDDDSWPLLFEALYPSAAWYESILTRDNAGTSANAGLSTSHTEQPVQNRMDIVLPKIAESLNNHFGLQAQGLRFVARAQEPMSQGYSPKWPNAESYLPDGSIDLVKGDGVKYNILIAEYKKTQTQGGETQSNIAANDIMKKMWITSPLLNYVMIIVSVIGHQADVMTYCRGERLHSDRFQIDLGNKSINLTPDEVRFVEHTAGLICTHFIIQINRQQENPDEKFDFEEALEQELTGFEILQRGRNPVFCAPPPKRETHLGKSLPNSTQTAKKIIFKALTVSRYCAEYFEHLFTLIYPDDGALWPMFPRNSTGRQPGLSQQPSPKSSLSTMTRSHTMQTRSHLRSQSTSKSHSTLFSTQPTEITRDKSLVYQSILPFVEGNVIEDWTKLTGEQKKNLFQMIAELHQKGLAHCDIRPPNVVWAGDTPALIDFEYAFSRRVPYALYVSTNESKSSFRNHHAEWIQTLHTVTKFQACFAHTKLACFDHLINLVTADASSLWFPTSTDFRDSPQMYWFRLQALDLHSVCKCLGEETQCATFLNLLTFSAQDILPIYIQWIDNGHPNIVNSEASLQNKEGMPSYDVEQLKKMSELDSFKLDKKKNKQIFIFLSNNAITASRI